MRKAFLTVILFTAGVSQAFGQFRYEVKRDKLWGAENGVLTIDENGIRYHSENGKTVLNFGFEDIRKADVSDPRKIRLFTYERALKRLTGPRQIEFSLREGATSSGLTQFLATNLERPVVGAYQIDESGHDVPAYHRHAFGGCHGTLRFGSAAVVFESEMPRHSRTWTFEDIQTIGTMSAYHFRLTSYTETFNFDLKQRLASEIYREVWRSVYTRVSPEQSTVNHSGDFAASSTPR